VRATPLLVAIALAVSLLAGCTAVVTVRTVAPTVATGRGSTAVPVVAAVSATETIRVGGVARHFLLRSPRHPAGETLPVVVALHGATGDALRFERTTGFTSLTQPDQFIAVYPDGSQLTGNHLVWNAGDCCGHHGRPAGDDIGFLSALVAALPSYGADPSRIYLAGFSNGGMMAYRAACDLGERIAGIAVVSGALNVQGCVSTNPLPVVIIHGTADATVPYTGGKPIAPLADGLTPWKNASVDDAVSTWVARDRCSAVPKKAVAGVVTQSRYRGCAPRGSVTLYTIAGGTHQWPHKPTVLDATALIVKAFVIR
jgi:polyhydroxybutyrate depolymerase